MSGMKQQLMIETQARSNLYGLLALFCRQEIDAELLGVLRTPEMTRALTDAGVNVAEALPPQDDQLLLEELAQAYTRTFVSPLQGEPYALAVQQFINEIGLELEGEQGLPPDHIAMELEIMQHLTDAEFQSIEINNHDIRNTARQKQKLFLKRILGMWGVQVFETIEQESPHPFYREIGTLGAAFLNQEMQTLLD